MSQIARTLVTFLNILKYEMMNGNTINKKGFETNAGYFDLNFVNNL